MNVTPKPGTYTAVQWQGPAAHAHPAVRPPTSLTTPAIAARYGVVDLPSGYKKVCEVGDWIVTTPEGHHHVMTQHEFPLYLTTAPAAVQAPVPVAASILD